MSLSRRILIEQLLSQSLAPTGSDNCEEASNRLRACLLLHGSHTPDNVDCVSRLDYGPTDDEQSSEANGIRLKRTGISLADLVFELANLKDIPEELSQRYPELTAEEYWSALHAVNLILLALQRDRVPTDAPSLSPAEVDQLIEQSLEEYRQMRGDI